MQVLGHRGSPTPATPENTLASVSAALRVRADGVEVDVRLTADGVAVCCHDDDLSRVGAPVPSVRATPWASLRRVRLAGGHRVPRLVEVAAAARDRGLLVLDLKPEPRAGALLQASLSALRRAGVPDDQVVASSFDERLLEVLAVRRPGLSRAPILDVGDPVAPALARARRRGDRALHLPLATLLDEPSAVAGLTGPWAAGAGPEVRVWTVNRLVDARLCELAGVAAVISDVPGELVAGLRLATAA